MQQLTRSTQYAVRPLHRPPIIYMRFFRCLRPHTTIPLPWRERGIQFPSTKASTLHEHMATRPHSGGTGWWG
eukprot:scaffold11206_cov117-Isochrysis_galbana.AAC.24